MAQEPMSQAITMGRHQPAAGGPGPTGQRGSASGGQQVPCGPGYKLTTPPWPLPSTCPRTPSSPQSVLG